MKKIVLILLLTIMLSGCSRSDKIVIYSNSDDEALEIIKDTLDKGGYKGQYEIQSFGSGDLMAKMKIENEDTQADIIMLSSFYMSSLDELYPELFVELGNYENVLSEYQDPKFYPILSLVGTIFYDEELLKSNNLKVPTSYKDLADPMYKGYLSIPDISSSTTGWLLVQAVLDNYPQEQAIEILSGIKDNATNQIESSGSGPIKKVELKEAAIGFGLRQQVNEVQSVTLVDPIEGNYTLNESYGVINNEDSERSKEMIELLINQASDDLLLKYPAKIRKEDIVNEDFKQKLYSEKLTDELLNEHIALWESL